MTLEDFTGLAVGVLVPTEGDVERCPVCGRNGVRESLAGGGCEWVHVESSEMLGDGLLVKPLECCSRPI
jgi:hypothetical protein